MFENIILIPARKGSERIKNKNIKKLFNQPLIYHTIKSSIESKCGPVFVSTDSLKYKNLAESYGAKVPFLRPKYLSQSKSPSIWVILHFLKWFKQKNGELPEFITFCPPTNPMLSEITINKMFNKLKKHPHVNSIVTYTIPKTHPFRIIGIEKNGLINNSYVQINGKTINDYERSQDFPVCFEGSPACRITKTSFFINLLEKYRTIQNVDYNKTYDHKNCLGYEISNLESSDIDSKSDFTTLNKLK